MLSVLLLTLLAGQAVVVDRVAVVLESRVIKTSDIERDTRITEFLNEQPLDLSAGARRKAVERLIDQMLIRREIELGGYSIASREDASNMLAGLRKERFRTEAAYKAALRRYGISEDDLQAHLRWQLTVLQFIEERFRPGVLIRDQEIERYFRETFVKTAASGTTLTPAVRRQIEEQITGERVNEHFNSWLKQVRDQAKPRFIDGALP